ncbi:MAG: M12 family metallopeptidase, partial [Gemmatimonadota bacterium]|nr:M12 family metallopeptidase [Gemmatimonadota bacterium]
MSFRRIFPLSLGLLLGIAACEDQTAPVSPTPEDAGPDPVQELPEPQLTPALEQFEGYVEVGEIRTGWIYGPDGSPMEVTYEIHDGQAIWQGDIVIGEAGEIAQTQAALDRQTGGPFRGVVIDGASFRWPGGVIPYTIDDATPSIVEAAIDWVEDQTPGVTLVPRDGETNYVTFRDASGCSSAIGMQGDQQFINLKVASGGTFCSVGNAAHEILHALGM